MKNLFCIFLAIFLAGTAFGQRATVNKNLEQGQLLKKTMGGAFTHAEAIGYLDGRYYCLLPTIRNFTEIGYIDKNLRTEKIERIETRLDGKEVYFEFAVKIKDLIWIFSSFENQKLKKNILFASVLGKTSLKPEGEPLVVAEVDYKGQSKYKNAVFSYALSPDTSKVLISYGLSSNSGDLFRFGFTVLDDKLQKLWGSENELPSSREGFYALNRYTVTNSGEAYLLCKLFSNKKDFKKTRHMKSRFLGKSVYVQEPNYAYRLFSYPGEGKAAGEIKLAVDGKFVRELNIMATPSNDLACAGIYAADETLSARGSCLFLVSATNHEISKAVFTPFDLSLITKGMSKKDAEEVKEDISKDDEYEDVYYQVKPLIFSSDGGFWMMAEQRRSEEKQQQTNMGIVVTKYHYHNDVYIVRYDSYGEVRWTNKLAKEQYTQDVQFVFGSFLPHAVGTHLYLLYNEIPRNLLSQPNPGKSKTMLAKYDAEGKEDIALAIDADDSDAAFSPLGSIPLDKNTLMLFGQEGLRKYRYSRLRLE